MEGQIPDVYRYNYMYFYKIGNIKVAINYKINLCNWKKFSCQDLSETSLFFQIIAYKQQRYGLEVIPIHKRISCFFHRNSTVMFVDETEKNYYILAPVSEDDIFAFLIQAYVSYAAKKSMLDIHSALIRINNSGLMFLGPSGIGKTTQAELWNKYRDALIINGDIVFVQETENAFLGWGTPWHGSSPYCENTSVPVHAMIVLKQAQENSIRELSGFEKVTAVSNSVFYPQWLENGMELCLETLDHLLSSVPVYELSCRPDEDAVRITEEAVFGGRL